MGVFFSSTSCVGERNSSYSGNDVYYSAPTYITRENQENNNKRVDHSNDMPANEVEWNALGSWDTDIDHRYHLPEEGKYY